jgi:DNA-damage-inducible protein J
MAISATLKTTDVRSRIEPDLKDRASEVLAACGLNLSDAIRLFLRQVVVQQGLPFEVKAPNAKTIAAMQEARSIGKAKFGSAKELFDDLEKAGSEKTHKSAKKQR